MQTLRLKKSPLKNSSDPKNTQKSVNRPKKISNKIKDTLRKIGPGLITGASDDDPSGIVTYSQAGALLGLTTLWTALVTFPLMAAIQGCVREPGW